MNAGYGGFIHGVTNGVPMVLGGGTEDKPEVSARGEFAGVAVNLRTGAPSKEQVADAVSKVFADSKFKERVVEIKKENEELDALSSIEQHIQQFASHWA
jgi:UDP:flavonoid glycosyltransferase YjiC (YdhE family)